MIDILLVAVSAIKDSESMRHTAAQLEGKIAALGALCGVDGMEPGELLRTKVMQQVKVADVAIQSRMRRSRGWILEQVPGMRSGGLLSSGERRILDNEDAVKETAASEGYTRNAFPCTLPCTHNEPVNLVRLTCDESAPLLTNTHARTGPRMQSVSCGCFAAYRAMAVSHGVWPSWLSGPTCRSL